MRPEVVCQLMNTKEEAGHLGQYLYRTRSIYGLHKTNHLHSDVMIWKLFFGITGPLWGESTDDFCIIGPLWEESTDDFCIIGIFVRGIHWSPVDCPHKGPVIHSSDIFFDILILAWTSCWRNTWVAGDLRCHDIQLMTSREQIQKRPHSSEVLSICNKVTYFEWFLGVQIMLDNSFHIHDAVIFKSEETAQSRPDFLDNRCRYHNPDMSEQISVHYVSNFADMNWEYTI